MIYALIEMTLTSSRFICEQCIRFEENTFLFLSHFMMRTVNSNHNAFFIYFYIIKSCHFSWTLLWQLLRIKRTHFECIRAQLSLMKIMSAVHLLREISCSLDRTIRMMASVCLKGCAAKKNGKRIMLLSAFDWFWIWSQFKYIDNQATFGRAACVGRILVWLKGTKKGILSVVHIDIFISVCRIYARCSF